MGNMNASGTCAVWADAWSGIVEDKRHENPLLSGGIVVEVNCFERGLIILGAGTTPFVSPPLYLTEENVDVAIEIFDEAIAASLA